MHQKKRAPAAATICPSGTASSSRSIGALSSSSRGRLRSNASEPLPPHGPCCASTSFLARSLGVGPTPPVDPSHSARPCRLDDAAVPTAAPALCRCLAGSCAGHAPPAVRDCLNVPAGWLWQGGGQASRPRETALPSRLCGDPSEHAGAATGTRIRHRLMLLGLSESRACPHSVSCALQQCRPGVACSALGGHVCVGEPRGVSEEARSGHQWELTRTSVRLPQDHALTSGVSQVSRGSPCCVACGTHRRTVPSACAQSSAAGALQRLAGVPARDDRGH